jgi:hypothetical protein
MNVIWKLPYPSTALLREPKLDALPKREWCLAWIAEKDEGGGRHEALLFTGVQSLKCTYFLAYSPELIKATYDQLVDFGKTSLLDQVISNLEGRTNTSKLKHLGISFDDGPLFEFIASGFEFRSPFDISVLESNLHNRIASAVHPFERK